MTEEHKILLEKIRESYQNASVNMVICDETNNTQEDIENRVVNITITIVPYKPLEHINFEVVLKKDD
jgi:phage tail sheath protein FI